MTIEFACPGCQQKYQVKDEFAGAQTACRQCGGAMQVPASEPEDDDAEIGLAQLLDEELRRPEPATESAASKSCPACSAELAGQAILCVHCGLDLRSGMKLSGADQQADAAPAEPGTKKKKKKNESRKASSGTGKFNLVSLARGAGLSAVAAAVAAVLWSGLMWLTWDWPNIVGGVINVAGILAVGSLAGVGMAAGHEDDDGRLAGVIAAIIGFIGIVLGRTLIVAFFLAGLGADDPMAEGDLDVEYAADILTEQRLRSKGQWTDDLLEHAYDDEYERALADARQMNAGDVQKLIEKYEAIEEAVGGLVAQRLEADGKSLQTIDIQEHNEALNKAYDELWAMPYGEIVALIESQAHEPGDDAGGSDEAAERQDDLDPDDADGEVEEDAGGGSVGAMITTFVFGILFFFGGGCLGPILMAMSIGSAYKIGSGRVTD